MSWNNVIPWWIYELQHEHHLASAACAFENEWFSGTSKVMPAHAIKHSKATFDTWKPGGWNYEYSEDYWDQLPDTDKDRSRNARSNWTGKF